MTVGEGGGGGNVGGGVKGGKGGGGIFGGGEQLSIAVCPPVSFVFPYRRARRIRRLGNRFAHARRRNTCTSLLSGRGHQLQACRSTNCSTEQPHELLDGATTQSCSPSLGFSN